MRRDDVIKRAPIKPQNGGKQCGKKRDLNMAFKAFKLFGGSAHSLCKFMIQIPLDENIYFRNRTGLFVLLDYLHCKKRIFYKFIMMTPLWLQIDLVHCLQFAYLSYLIPLSLQVMFLFIILTRPQCYFPSFRSYLS